jgi:integrase
MAVAENYLQRNPADLLFVPREAPRAAVPHMTADQVKLLFSVLDLREKVIGGMAVIAGMRPGEIFGLRRDRLDADHVEIIQRIYKGKLDTPKTAKSVRFAALGTGLSMWIQTWLEMLPSTSPDAWVFPSERLTTPLSKDNCWRRHFKPRLERIGLCWVNFQVLRKTHSCLLSELGVDPQVRADQMGHSVDVNQNQYTNSYLARRKDAVDALEQTLTVM